MKLFLSGPMGAGKSTVGRAIAERTGRPFVDLDARVASRAGKGVGEIFRELGEPRFRELEREELAHVLAEEADDAVVALGGGTVTHRATRRRLLVLGTLVTLRAGVDTLATRVAHDTGRPLLAGRDAKAALAELLEERADAYAEAHAVVECDGHGVAAIAVEALAREAAHPIVVPLGTRTYRVEVGRGTRASLPSRIGGASAGDVVIVTDARVEEPWAAEVERAAVGAGRRVVRVVLEPGEGAKHLGSIERIWDAALGARIDRHALVIAVGGGVVGDLAGFAASTLLRGVAFAQVPTTLLAMVDASVGGKTGFDRPDGKNLIGTFHQPSFVVCDVDTLETLPDAERISGLAEVAKSAWLASEDAVLALERDADALRAGDLEATERAVRMSVALKASIVSDDEREGGLRRLLNLGHTVGHAFEVADGYGSIRHGEAVARGLVAAFGLSRELGRASTADETRMTALLGRLGLPTDLRGRATARVDELLATDKKREGASVGFVAPRGPGDVEVVTIPLERLRSLLARVCA